MHHKENEFHKLCSPLNFMNPVFIVSSDTQEKVLSLVLLHTEATLVHTVFCILTIIAFMFYVFNNSFIDPVPLKVDPSLRIYLVNYNPVSRSQWFTFYREFQTLKNALMSALMTLVFKLHKLLKQNCSRHSYFLITAQVPQQNSLHFQY